ncbi:hypothetical protein OPW41_18175 [Vibrio europaeus]|uniref:hypothetical protein n=1 Tax=Vibrio europaeus TaxID=300876 RepID=UPI00233F44CE|nr:hypothetical protein [Vibrio europaeus]MDC5753831.1 hypothetical protein [Vibrio europaeus]MDC5776743.1 hypothetical protein [Vibrio europaeus]MDC5796759.1 hypothetical protein [Vibrio europaeus]MDC5801756.1 hypothetical protein [Vibrio europaeus]MDC5815729.1 hypothetical protein [Vibrio europaeus]
MKSSTEVYKLMGKLQAQGCMPQPPLKTPRGALINIKQPTPEMAKYATEIKQCLNGVQSMVYAIKLGGCTIRWQGGQTCQTH